MRKKGREKTGIYIKKREGERGKGSLETVEIEKGKN